MLLHYITSNPLLNAIRFPLREIIYYNNNCILPIRFIVLLIDGIVDWLSLGERQNSKLCKTNSVRPEGSVETSLSILLIEHCDYSETSNEENM